ncbi:MAG TPA: S8 family serine peptidase, partial [Candidatus Udaeobacter sp.]|nr:S8 family serine peptidase [Candidatus Udaeobacter sp.]
AVSSTEPRLATRLRSLGLDHGREIARFGTLHYVRLISSSASFDPTAAAADLRASGLVRAAIPNLRMRLFDTLPNDIDVVYQWYVSDGGFADVHLPGAWDIGRGSASVRIGIMDTGVDLGHPDLASKIWTNPGEIPGNGIDDDGDGHIDDVHGWDFGNEDADANPEPAVFDSSLGIPVDVSFHGTFVAGIAAAATDNSEGIAGASWNCSVVPLKVADSTGDIPASAVTEAFAYATRHHLEVLNMSLGTANGPGIPEYFQPMVDQATAAGVLCVASAGNDGTSDPNYPAACPGVLSVAATDANNARSSFSNWGPVVRIAAPGEGMWSAICRNYTIDETSLLIYYIFFGWDGESPYMYGDGTSFSSPLAAGVCGLVRAQYPAWTPAQVLDHIVATGDTVAYDEPIGPKLNAARAMSAALTDVASSGGAVPMRVTPNPFASRASMSFSLSAAADAQVRILDCSGRLVRELERGTLSAGPHAVAWDGTDARGAPVRAGIYFIELTRGSIRERAKIVRLR